MVPEKPSYFHVDAFSGAPFAGNPAAVCVLDGERPTEWQQQLAADMNLSETAFLRRDEDQEDAGSAASRWHLRWFTPRIEVDLCGHATLASAHVLWSSRRVDDRRAIDFLSRSGRLTARRNEDWIDLDFPARGERRCEAPSALLEGLGVMPLYVGRSDENDLLVEVDHPDTLRGIVPDQNLLGTLDARGIIVTCRSDRGRPDRGRAEDRDFDFLSRFFAPASGVPEDPVTGSAHCCLAPFWSRRLNRNELVGFQASSRGGVVKTRVEGDRVILSGQAVTVAQGELCL